MCFGKCIASHQVHCSAPHGVLHVLSYDRDPVSVSVRGEAGRGGSTPPRARGNLCRGLPTCERPRKS